MNDQRPIRIAVLGGESTGKTSFVSRLTLDIVHEAHYPTKSQTNWLFDFKPRSKLSKTLLDGRAHERLLRRTPGSQALEPIFRSPSVSPEILLSPLVFQSFMDNFTNLKNQVKGRSSSNHMMKNLDLKKTQDNQFYQYVNNNGSPTDGDHRKNRNMSSIENIPRNYIPPSYTPIPIDIIDTPGFKPEMVVPFLEVSLFRNLDKSILKGLADEPRQPVSTTSLLVASGASELNGKIDGYVLVYSAIPELSHHSTAPPPAYSTSSILPTAKRDLEGGAISTLPSIRSCILDAWTEYRNYQTNWELGQEDDVYSLVHNLKNIWKTQESEQAKQAKVDKLRKFKTTLNSIDMDPASPDSPPPCLIVCTHVNDELASPVLIEKGRELATNWKCGFVAVDNMDDFNVDVALSLIIKEIVEKERLISSKTEGGSGLNGSTNATDPSNMFRRMIK